MAQVPDGTERQRAFERLRVGQTIKFHDEDGLRMGLVKTCPSAGAVKVHPFLLQAFLSWMQLRNAEVVLWLVEVTVKEAHLAGPAPVWPVAEGDVPPLALPASGATSRTRRAGRVCFSFVTGMLATPWSISGLWWKPAACAWKEAADALHERLLEEEAAERRARAQEQLARDQAVHGRLLLLASAAEVLEEAPLDKVVPPRGRARRARR